MSAQIVGEEGTHCRQRGGCNIVAAGLSFRLFLAIPGRRDPEKEQARDNMEWQLAKLIVFHK
jgi:hypothetical protein